LAAISRLPIVALKAQNNNSESIIDNCLFNPTHLTLLLGCERQSIETVVPSIYIELRRAQSRS
jgi:hypothetical protein